jgi:hypothetical protein
VGQIELFIYYKIWINQISSLFLVAGLVLLKDFKTQWYEEFGCFINNPSANSSNISSEYRNVTTYYELSLREAECAGLSN